MVNHDHPSGAIVRITVINNLSDPTKCPVCGADRRPHLCI